MPASSCPVRRPSRGVRNDYVCRALLDYLHRFFVRKASLVDGDRHRHRLPHTRQPDQILPVDRLFRKVDVVFRQRVQFLDGLSDLPGHVRVDAEAHIIADPLADCLYARDVSFAPPANLEIENGETVADEVCRVFSELLRIVALEKPEVVDPIPASASK